MKAYNVIYASCKGQKEDYPYQDFIKVVETDAYLLAALADGLGSSKQSSRGACLICDVLADLFAKYDRETSSVANVFQNAIEEWYKRLEQKGVNSKECLTTSSALFVDKLSSKAIFGHIGDSLIVYRKGKETIHSLSEEKDFLNETDCIGPSKHPQYRIEEVEMDSTLDFIIASDGFGDELIKEKTDLLFDYFIEKYSRARPKKRNATLKKELAATMQNKNNDDKSVIFGWIQ